MGHVLYVDKFLQPAEHPIVIRSSTILAGANVGFYKAASDKKWRLTREERRQLRTADCEMDVATGGIASFRHIQAIQAGKQGTCYTAKVQKVSSHACVHTTFTIPPYRDF